MTGVKKGKVKRVTPKSSSSNESEKEALKFFRMKNLLQPPELVELSDLDLKMEEILSRSDLSPSQKSRLYYNVLSRFRHLLNEGAHDVKKMKESVEKFTPANYVADLIQITPSTENRIPDLLTDDVEMLVDAPAPHSDSRPSMTPNNSGSIVVLDPAETSLNLNRGSRDPLHSSTPIQTNIHPKTSADSHHQEDEEDMTTHSQDIEFDEGDNVTVISPPEENPTPKTNESEENSESESDDDETDDEEREGESESESGSESKKLQLSTAFAKLEEIADNLDNDPKAMLKKVIKNLKENPNSIDKIFLKKSGSGRDVLKLISPVFYKGYKTLPVSLFSDIMEYLFSRGSSRYYESIPTPKLGGKKQPAAIKAVLRFLLNQGIFPSNHDSKFPKLQALLKKHRSSLDFLSENTNIQSARERRPVKKEKKGAGFFVNFDKWNHHLDI
jgi:hypothetical protein